MRARIRSIKPEVFKDEDLWDLAQETGFPILQAFQGLWCCADREGRFKWKPRELKTDILPYWDGDFALVMDALERRGFITSYVVDAKRYGLVRTFKEHQVINQREAKSVLPPPPSEALGTHVHAHARTGGGEKEYAGVNVPRSLAFKVFARDGAKCVRCGSEDDLTVDHIFPRSSGGTHSLSNLRTLCRSCNSARPVSGQALLDDLARDGLSMSDKERMCAHVHAHGELEGKGKEGKGTERSLTRTRELPELPDPIPDNPEIPLPEKPYSVVVRYRERFEAAKRVPYAPTGNEWQAWDELKKLIVDTAALRDETAAELGERVLESFFADSFAASKDWPVKLLRSQFSRHVEPPAQPKPKAEQTTGRYTPGAAETDAYLRRTFGRVGGA